MNEPILSVNGVTKRFGGLVALRDISFDVGKGEVVGLMGPNGAGKTTLLNIIAGEYAPDSGTVTFKGCDITGCPPHRACHLGIARTYQIPQPFVTLTALENLMVAAVFGRQLKKRTTELDYDRIFDLVHLSEKRDTLAGNLPILSLKKLELARALARDPELILLDEVAAGITEVEIPRVLATIREIRNMGVTIVIIEHVMKVLVNVVDRIVVIDKGMKIAEGPPAAVMNDCKVMEAYFGA
ncbi:MAG TPA: ABC transporter ATP-binding protein [Syntrophorhabdales bacterium]|nr:ABC transporter ATP-binding protein [Syntrophorhabdales bacterium]